MLIIGIDPGISGSICFFQDGEIFDLAIESGADECSPTMNFMKFNVQ